MCRLGPRYKLRRSDSESVYIRVRVRLSTPHLQGSDFQVCRAGIGIRLGNSLHTLCDRGLIQVQLEVQRAAQAFVNSSRVRVQSSREGRHGAYTCTRMCSDRRDCLR